MNEQMIIALLLASLAAMAFSARAYSADASIMISSPKDGATISSQKQDKVVFNVHPSPDGNHLHFYIDKGRPTIVRMWKGSFTLPMLSPGKHEICIREAMVNHILTGLHKCISVTAR